MPTRISQSTDQILAKWGIDNPADATLVRLAGAAAFLPEEVPEKLMARVELVNIADKAVANAIIDAVRSNQPPPTPASTPRWVAAALLILACGTVALSVYAWGVRGDAGRLRTDGDRQKADIARLTGIMQSLAKANGASEAKAAIADAAQENASKLGSAVQKQAELIEILRAENSRLASGQPKTSVPSGSQ